MNVYHNSSIDGQHGPHARKLTPHAVRKTFFWETMPVHIPAIYLGTAGAVLDVCAKIPAGAMTEYLKKWKKNHRYTMEELEELEAENPAGRDFSIEMCLNDIPLRRRLSSSLLWYPADRLQAAEYRDLWRNEKEAARLINAYGCDPDCCWHLGRICYRWDSHPLLSPQTITLRLEDTAISLTAAHFTTKSSCNGQTVTAVHPVTGQVYTLTLHECRQIRNDFTAFGKKGVLYPQWCHLLSYSVSPKDGHTILTVKDCSESDTPKNSPENRIQPDSAAAAAAVLYETNTVPDAADTAMAVSSLHFEPVSEIRWRVVYSVKRKKDMEISFPLPQALP